MLLVLMLTSQEETSSQTARYRAKKEKLKLLTEILQIMVVHAGTCSVRYEFTRRSHLRFIRQPKLKPHLHEQVFFDKEKLLV